MSLIDRLRRDRGSAVLLVTHEINPILPLVDRILYLVGGRWAIGTPGEVMTSERLSDLYGAAVDVLRVRDRIIVVGAPDLEHDHLSGGHHHVADERGQQRGLLP
jgi:zinc/manganese transport system ATP-binding protein